MWELACLEHNVAKDGTPVCTSPEEDTGIESHFVQCANGNYTPRAMLIDLDPTVVGKSTLNVLKSTNLSVPFR